MLDTATAATSEPCSGRDRLGSRMADPGVRRQFITCRQYPAADETAPRLRSQSRDFRERSSRWAGCAVISCINHHPEPPLFRNAVSPAAPPPWILSTIVLSQFAGTSLWFAGNAVLPDLQARWGLSPTAIGRASSAVQLGFIFGTLLFAFGNLSDRVSPRRLFSPVPCWVRPATSSCWFYRRWSRRCSLAGVSAVFSSPEFIPSV